MSDDFNSEKYDLVFSGQVVKGVDLAVAKKNIGQLFKLDAKKVEALFSGKKVVLKRGLNMDAAGKYRVAIKKAGALVELVMQQPVAPSRGKAVFGEPPAAGGSPGPGAIPGTGSMMLGNDEHFRKLPQVLFNGIDHQRKLAFVNEIQEELRESNPSAQELIGGVLTIIRRANTSLMRIETLNRSLKSASTPAEQAVDSEAPVDTGEKRVLVVDDSKDNLELMDWILDDTGIDHDCVRSGREALKAVMQTNYSLLLLDIGLPDLRGDEVTRRLRATRSYGKVPIVAVTVHSSKTEIEQLLAAGVNEVLAKPVDQEKLLKTVRGYLAGQTS